MVAIAEVKLTKRMLRSLVGDTVKSAEAINLVYVSHADPGIGRRKNGQGFIYLLHGKKVTDKTTLERIKKLVIPPAWQHVWICTNELGHLQATGIDALGRKQYKYHPLWTRLRNHTKFYHLFEFGHALPVIRERLAADLTLPGMPQEKVLALVVSILQETGIRIGSSTYEKLYGSFGLSTLKNRHVQVNGSRAKFSFKGKKGVYQNLTLTSKKLVRLIRKCQDLPGRELFQYYDADGNRHAIDSGMVNNYIRDISGGSFTAKDFRTWTGTVQALLAFKEIGTADTVTETKRRIIAALDIVAAQLGNTRSVCKKYYVHPQVLDLYESGGLDAYLQQLDQGPDAGVVPGLRPEETVLMQLLKKA